MSPPTDLASLQTRYLLAVDLSEDAAGRPLTARQERFCQLWVRYRNQVIAYREAYNVPPTTLAVSAGTMAMRVARLPQVHARIQELGAIALAGVVLDVRELILQDFLIASADPNDLVKLVRRNCRKCHGIGYEHQWADINEYVEACIAVMDFNAQLERMATAKRPPLKPMPSDAGGYGYHRGIEPNELCPHCLGVGEHETIISDTTKLTGAAKALYKGVKETKNGIEVLLHDQDAARARLAQYAGLAKTLDVDQLMAKAAEARKPGPGGRRNTLAADISEDDAARAYLTLVE